MPRSSAAKSWPWLTISTRAKPLFDQNREQFRQFFTAQAKGRGLSAAIIIRPDGSTVERADVSMAKPVVLPSPQLLSKITETEPQVALIPQGDHVAAAVKLRGYDNMYLYVAQMLDPTRGAATGGNPGEHQRIRQS